MFKRHRLLLAATVALSAASAHANAAAYTFAPFDVPGALAGSTIPYAINAAGQVVGQYEDRTGIHSFVDTNGAFATFDVPGASATYARGINDKGQVSGDYADSTGGHGFVDTNGAFATIDGPGARATSASGINAAGQVVGNYGDSTGGHGFVATPVPEPSSLAMLGLGGLGLLRRLTWPPARAAACGRKASRSGRSLSAAM